MIGPAKPAAQPVDGNRIVFPIANILAIVVSVIGATTWAASTLSQEAQAVGGRITRVEYSVEALSREILAMTRAVDLGVSTIQADSWIALFRANLAALDIPTEDAAARERIAQLKRALAGAVPDLPKRER